jgi:hypothetical protein
MSIKNGCGRPECKVSTGICGSITFGYGELDYYGYWEFPCYKCAREWKRIYPKDECWPDNVSSNHEFCVDWNN